MQKQLEWVPVSAALLVTGAMALAFGSLVSPTGSDSTDTLRIVQEQDGRWMIVAVVYFLASVALTLGLPAILTLFERRGRNLALASGLVLAFGFIGTAGYAMLMVFFRALVITNSIVDQNLDEVTNENGLSVFLYGWIAAFYLGELLLAIALLLARTTPQWVPIVLIAHVATLPLGPLLPDLVVKASVMLLALGFAGIAIQAVSRDSVRQPV